MEYTQLKHSEINTLKQKLLEQNNYKCPICGKSLSLNDAVLDHVHRLNKSQVPGENGYGLVRNAICRECNLIEGKITNALRRYKGITNTLDKIEFLYRLIDYYQIPLTEYIHPTEKLPKKKVSKRQYNKLKTLYSKSGKKAKFPEYPKSGELTQKLKKLFEDFEISPYL